MGCSMKAIYDDENDYLENCKRLSVSPVYDKGHCDCYGPHGDWVKLKLEGKTELSWEAFKKNHDLEKLNHKKQKLETEIEELKKQIGSMK